MRQKDIAEKVGLSKVRVSEIVSGSKSSETEQAPDFTNSDLTVTAKLKDELEALRRTQEIAQGAEIAHVPAVTNSDLTATDDSPNLGNQTGSGGHNARGLHEFLGVGEIT